MSQRRSRRERLLRKGRRVRKREQRTEADQRLAEARAELEKVLFEANEAYRKGVAKLALERDETRKEAHDDYEQRRNTILKVYADEQDEAAA